MCGGSSRSSKAGELRLWLELLREEKEERVSSGQRVVEQALRSLLLLSLGSFEEKKKVRTRFFRQNFFF